jgi:hypothetical protein
MKSPATSTHESASTVFVRDWLSTDLMAFHTLFLCLQQNLGVPQIAARLQGIVNGMIEDAELPADLDTTDVNWEQLALETPRLVREAQASLGF